MELVIFCEELSAKAFLDEFLPPHLPQGTTLVTIKHEGKTDLQKSLPRKLKAWLNPEAKFIVLHDKDHNDCIQLKAQLRSICTAARPNAAVLIRIACHELESWYLGDPIALKKRLPEVQTRIHTREGEVPERRCFVECGGRVDKAYTRIPKGEWF